MFAFFCEFFNADVTWLGTYTQVAEPGGRMGPGLPLLNFA